MRRFFGAADYLLVLGGHLTAAVDDGDDKLCVFHRLVRAHDAQSLYLIVRFTQTGGVRKAQENAAQPQLFLDGVARRARDIRDDRAVIAQNGVQKRAFSGVGSADYGGGDAAVQELSARVAVGKALELRYGGMKLRFVSYKRKILNILVGVIQNGVVVRAQVGEKIINFIYPARYRAAELTGGVFGGLGSLGIDDIRHRLGARKIHAPV